MAKCRAATSPPARRKRRDQRPQIAALPAGHMVGLGRGVGHAADGRRRPTEAQQCLHALRPRRTANAAPRTPPPGPPARRRSCSRPGMQRRQQVGQHHHAVHVAEQRRHQRLPHRGAVGVVAPSQQPPQPAPARQGKKPIQGGSAPGAASGNGRAAGRPAQPRPAGDAAPSGTAGGRSPPAPRHRRRRAGQPGAELQERLGRRPGRPAGAASRPTRRRNRPPASAGRAAIRRGSPAVPAATPGRQAGGQAGARHRQLQGQQRDGTRAGRPAAAGRHCQRLEVGRLVEARDTASPSGRQPHPQPPAAQPLRQGRQDGHAGPHRQQVRRQRGEERGLARPRQAGDTDAHGAADQVGQRRDQLARWISSIL